MPGNTGGTSVKVYCLWQTAPLPHPLGGTIPLGSKAQNAPTRGQEGLWEAKDRGAQP